jgi:hypothetical protein
VSWGPPSLLFFQQGEEDFFEFGQGFGQRGFLLVGPGGCIDGGELDRGLAHPFDDIRGDRRRPFPLLFACGQLCLLILVLGPGRGHAAILLLAGDLDQGFPAHRGIGAARVPDLLGQTVEGKDLVDGGSRLADDAA